MARCVRTTALLGALLILAACEAGAQQPGVHPLTGDGGVFAATSSTLAEGRAKAAAPARSHESGAATMAALAEGDVSGPKAVDNDVNQRIRAVFSPKGHSEVSETASKTPAAGGRAAVGQDSSESTHGNARHMTAETAPTSEVSPTPPTATASEYKVAIHPPGLRSQICTHTAINVTWAAPTSHGELDSLALFKKDENSFFNVKELKSTEGQAGGSLVFEKPSDEKEGDPRLPAVQGEYEVKYLKMGKDNKPIPMASATFTVVECPQASTRTKVDSVDDARKSEHIVNASTQQLISNSRGSSSSSSGGSSASEADTSKGQARSNAGEPKDQTAKAEGGGSGSSAGEADTSKGPAGSNAGEPKDQTAKAEEGGSGSSAGEAETSKGQAGSNAGEPRETSGTAEGDQATKVSMEQGPVGRWGGNNGARPGNVGGDNEGDHDAWGAGAGGVPKATITKDQQQWLYGPRSKSGAGARTDSQSYGQGLPPPSSPDSPPLADARPKVVGNSAAHGFPSEQEEGVKRQYRVASPSEREQAFAGSSGIPGEKTGGPAASGTAAATAKAATGSVAWLYAMAGISPVTYPPPIVAGAVGGGFCLLCISVLMVRRKCKGSGGKQRGGDASGSYFSIEMSETDLEAGVVNDEFNMLARESSDLALGGGDRRDSAEDGWGDDDGWGDGFEDQVSYPTLTALNKNGVKVLFDFEKSDPDSLTTIVMATIRNSSKDDLSNFSCKVAVPKHLQITIGPPSSTILRGNGGAITQTMNVTNAHRGVKPLKMRMVLQYLRAGKPERQEADIMSFPQGL